ncbi:MAG: DUF2339 domain-containing protein [Oligoflexia bacterium]|nr:DUF2339 domain-containing protein [Oligoflexia bacterium]
MSDSLSQVISALEDLKLRMLNLEKRMDSLEGEGDAEAITSPPSPLPLSETPPSEIVINHVIEKKPSFINTIIAFFTEGNPLNKIGAVTLIICISLGFKYAVDNDLIGPTGRVLIGIILGMVFLGLGEWFYKKNWSQVASGFLGTGEAALFISIYASQQLYQLIPALLAFPLYLLVLAVVTIQSLRYNLQAIAVMGLLGAFLIPILASTGSNDFISLSIYLFLLNVGIYWVVLQKQWIYLKWLAFTFTEIYLLAWAIKISTSTPGYAVHYSLSLEWFIAFLTIFFCFFTIIPTQRTFVKKELFDLSDIYMVVANGVAAFGMLYSLLNNDHRPILGLVAIIVAAAFFSLCERLIKSNFLDKKAFNTFLGVGAWYLFSAIPMVCSGHAITVAWSFVAILITLVSVYKKIPNLYLHVFVVMAIAVFRLFFVDTAFVFFDYADASQSRSLFEILFQDPKNYTILSVCIALATLAYYSKYFEKWNVHTDKFFLATIALASLFFYNIIFSGIFLTSNIIFGDLKLIWALLCLLLIISAKKLAVNECNQQRFNKILHIMLLFFLLYIVFAGIASYDRMFKWSPWDVKNHLSEISTASIVMAHLLTFAYLIIIYCGIVAYRGCKQLFDAQNKIRYAYMLVLLFIISMAIKRELFIIIFYNMHSLWDLAFYEKKALYEMAVSSVYALLTFGLYWFAIKREDKKMIQLAYVLYILTGFKIYFHDLSGSSQIYRVLSLFVFGVLLMTSSSLAKKFEKQKE